MDGVSNSEFVLLHRSGFFFDLFVLLREFLFFVIIAVGFFPFTFFFHKKSRTSEG